ncbi:PolC-type DNA polymerase III [Bacillus sp. Marseille-Q1617]|uniref:3'-5' exonuclease n=1 Tax=Bacillus sp. Marseille-Q1617 TaxID=2736887 RepID=UPI001588B312|nr:3'-5' exonuclease [Bacillus sp. Marseille-Q1617]
MTCPLEYDSIPMNRAIEEITFIVFDTETTGFRVNAGDQLLEIGAVRVEGYNVKDKMTFQSFSNPNRLISQEISDLTGIGSNDVEGAPSAQEAIRDFFDFLSENKADCLVGHYVSFDELVLKSELKRTGSHLQIDPSIDTLNLIGYLAPSYDMRDLERYAQLFGTRMYPRHRAVNDALTTAYLFVELLELLRDRKVDTWGELLRVSRGRG